jgi:DNA-3-methyladenine glycosylase II
MAVTPCLSGKCVLILPRDSPWRVEPLKFTETLVPLMSEEQHTETGAAERTTTPAEGAMATLRQDDALVPYISDHGPVTLEPAEDLYERLVVSLIRQQVSMEAAEAIRDRLFDGFEVTPERMLEADPERLGAVGLSEAKVEYVKSTADAFLDQGYSRQFFQRMDDEEALEELTAIRGVGPWTGKMFLMFGLGRPDVFPVEDLGVRRGIELVCETEMTRGEMKDRATEWAPYRSYASLYLWRAYEG